MVIYAPLDSGKRCFQSAQFEAPGRHLALSRAIVDRRPCDEGITMKKVAIVGAGQSRYGEFPDKGIKELFFEAYSDMS